MSEEAKHTPGPWESTRGGAVMGANPDTGVRLKRGVAMPQIALVVGLHEGRPDGEREANAALIAQAPKLLEFKQYVHKRLDTAGVTVDPESSHKAQGCRIGGRLDELIGERDRLRAENAKLRDACDTAAQALEGFDLGFARRARAELLAALPKAEDGEAA